MKKIYSKFTKDRVQKFQIETYIAVESDKKYVAKRALNADAENHIDRMYQFYEDRKESGLYCPASIPKTGNICFEFLEGTTLCKEMLNALAHKNKAEFLDLLSKYTEILKICQESEKKVADKEEVDARFVEVFGEWKFTESMLCARNLDIDLTFDNIIHEATTKCYKIIDYEWFFPFEVPLKYVIYRAIFAFHLKYASAMKNVIELQQIYDLFKISAEEILLFEEMNTHFDAYVYGTYGMHQIYEKYKKETISVRKLLPEENLFLQLFVNDGTAYREELAVTKTLEGRKISISIPIVVEPGYTLRIDPLNVSCVLKNLEIQVTLSDNVTYFEKEYEHNAIISSNQFTFISEDPQLLIKNCYPQSIQRVFISFEILQAGMYELPIRSSMEKLQKQMVETQKQIISLEQENKKIQDELNLIKDSKVYQSLLAKKIDKLMGELYS